MGLGLAALGRPGYINLGHDRDLQGDYDEQKMEQHTHLMLAEARKFGVNYFDAAQSYGKAESFLSSWLQNNPKEDVIVGSKWGYYYTAGWSVNADKHEIKEHTADRLNAQWPESKKWLGDRLALYQIHSATFESGVLENNEVLDRLYELKSAGCIIGLSLSGPQQADVLEAAMRVDKGGDPLFGSVQATFNLLEQSAGQSLKRAADQGLGVIIKEGVANGRLTSRNEDAPYMMILSSLAEKYQVGVDAIALAYILQKDIGHVVLSGAVTLEHLQSNMMAAEVTLTGKEIRELDALRMRSENYWKIRSELEWN